MTTVPFLDLVLKGNVITGKIEMATWRKEVAGNTLLAGSCHPLHTLKAIPAIGELVRSKWNCSDNGVFHIEFQNICKRLKVPIHLCDLGASPAAVRNPRTIVLYLHEGCIGIPCRQGSLPALLMYPSCSTSNLRLRSDAHRIGTESKLTQCSHFFPSSSARCIRIRGKKWLHRVSIWAPLPRVTIRGCIKETTSLVDAAVHVPVSSNS